MIDAGSTTMVFARLLAFAETRVTAITNSLQIGMILGQSASARVILAPGHYLPKEAAVVGIDTCDFLSRYHVNACFLGAAGLSEAGVTEAVEGFAAVKRTMMRQSAACRFLIDASKFGLTQLDVVARFDEMDTLISDRAPDRGLATYLSEGGVRILAP
ncbi:DeoR/GlpR family DNA-binding transcription regulator [uncultured Salipiger sp.]|uniref:DeoR/GlpR family DNA-binding transcription regulator n=1 Tax=uncultured Salipiger sp. TaxID=499810 RepID=UPI00259646CE|nr:DeoR/GlpR family DNA-binding transcription regulator [uncultured Salipiger sp.]